MKSAAFPPGCRGVGLDGLTPSPIQASAGATFPPRNGIRAPYPNRRIIPTDGDASKARGTLHPKLDGPRALFLGPKQLAWLRNNIPSFAKLEAMMLPWRAIH